MNPYEGYALVRSIYKQYLKHGHMQLKDNARCITLLTLVASSWAPITQCSCVRFLTYFLLSSCVSLVTVITSARSIEGLLTTLNRIFNQISTIHELWYPRNQPMDRVITVNQLPKEKKNTYQSTAKIRWKPNQPLSKVGKNTILQLKFVENPICLWMQYIAKLLELALP